MRGKDGKDMYEHTGHLWSIRVEGECNECCVTIVGVYLRMLFCEFNKHSKINEINSNKSLCIYTGDTIE